MIKAYTGKANNFKTGLVFDDDPDFGDKVNITVIVTGIHMPLVQPQVEIGNIITIDNSFTYKKYTPSTDEGFVLPETRSYKIGYNNASARKRIVFDDGCKPVLLVGEGDNRSDLENTAAIRRKALQPAKRED